MVATRDAYRFHQAFVLPHNLSVLQKTLLSGRAACIGVAVEFFEQQETELRTRHKRERVENVNVTAVRGDLFSIVMR